MITHNALSRFLVLGITATGTKIFGECDAGCPWHRMREMEKQAWATWNSLSGRIDQEFADLEKSRVGDNHLIKVEQDDARVTITIAIDANTPLEKIDAQHPTENVLNISAPTAQGIVHTAIRARGNSITITGSREERADQEDKDSSAYHYAHQSYSHTFGGRVDLKNPEIAKEDGRLVITLPRIDHQKKLKVVDRSAQKSAQQSIEK